MKNYYYFFFLCVLLLSVCSCEKSVTNSDENTGDNDSICYFQLSGSAIQGNVYDIDQPQLAVCSTDESIKEYQEGLYYGIFWLEEGSLEFIAKTSGGDVTYGLDNIYSASSCNEVQSLGVSFSALGAVLLETGSDSITITTSGLFYIVIDINSLQMMIMSIGALRTTANNDYAYMDDGGSAEGCSFSVSDVEISSDFKVYLNQCSGIYFSGFPYVGSGTINDSNAYVDLELSYGMGDSFGTLDIEGDNISVDEDGLYDVVFNWDPTVKGIAGITYSVTLKEIPLTGMQVVGEATGTDFYGEDFMMGLGINEADDNATRSGMYEKYIALEADKPFRIRYCDDLDRTYYGAELSSVDLSEESDNPDIIVKEGTLVKGDDAPTMKVSESGLYHIIVDVNKYEDLDDAMIVVAPVQWGVRGSMNSWGNTYFDTPTFNAETMTYTMTEVTDSTAGSFKFAYGGGWKIQLDDNGNVKANTNLGYDDDQIGLKPGGDDIDIAKGIFTITLTWTLTGGAPANSYEFTLEQTGTLANTDWSDVTLGIIGGGVANSDATDAASWTAPYLANTPSVDGEVYTYTMSGVELSASGEFKFKDSNDNWWGVGSITTITGDAREYVSGTDCFVMSTAGTYDITIVIDAASSDAMSMTIKEAS